MKYPHFSILKRSALVAICLGLNGAPAFAQAGVDAQFVNGESAIAADAFPGKAGNGWAGPWVRVPAQAEAQVSLVNGNQGKLVKVEYRRASDDQRLSSAFALSRKLEDKHGALDLSAPYEISFDFRTETVLTGNEGYYITSSGQENLAGTAPINTWLLRGGTSWTWINGDKTGKGPLVNSGMPVTPGTTYHFKLTVRPESKTWSVSIDNGTTRVESGELGFRGKGEEPSRVLYFGAELRSATSTAVSSLGSIAVKPLR